jgi:hypothetical protein
MRIGELARRAGVSQKAVRYCERLGLVVPGRSGNGIAEVDRVIASLVARRERLVQAGGGRCPQPCEGATCDD